MRWRVAASQPYVISATVLASARSPDGVMSGGPIAAVREGDLIVFDLKKRELRVEVSDSELKQRLASWKPPQPRYGTGVMAKYANQVSSASRGAVTI